MLKIFLFIISFGFVFGITNDFQSDQSRVINGQAASPGQYPWMVAIFITRTQSTMFCGGTLIRPNRVLTAAHCVAGDVRRLSLNFGGVRLGANEEGRQTLLIPEMNDTIRIHESYNPITMYCDVAIIRLVINIGLTNRIQIIQLPEIPPITQPRDDEEITVRVSGWGMASIQASGLSDNLRWANLLTTNITHCGNNVFPGANTELIICAHGTPTNGNNICHGDFGSPIVQYNAQSPQLSTLVGVASFLHQTGCGSPEPTGFTRILAREIITWINTQVQQP